MNRYRPVDIDICPDNLSIIAVNNQNTHTIVYCNFFWDIFFSSDSINSKLNIIPVNSKVSTQSMQIPQFMSNGETLLPLYEK